jgi:hypothetical protein
VSLIQPDWGFSRVLLLRLVVGGELLVRIGFDWIDVLVSDHNFSLSERVRPAYLAAYAVLNYTHLARTAICARLNNDAKSEEEFADAG